MEKPLDDRIRAILDRTDNPERAISIFERLRLDGENDFAETVFDVVLPRDGSLFEHLAGEYECINDYALEKLEAEVLEALKADVAGAKSTLLIGENALEFANINISDIREALDYSLAGITSRVSPYIYADRDGDLDIHWPEANGSIATSLEDVAISLISSWRASGCWFSDLLDSAELGLEAHEIEPLVAVFDCQDIYASDFDARIDWHNFQAEDLAIFSEDVSHKLQEGDQYTLSPLRGESLSLVAVLRDDEVILQKDD